MSYINTDIYDYLPSLIGNGFPPMSPDMREIKNPIIANNSKDSYYQIHPKNLSGVDYLKERSKILKKGPLNKYHQENLKNVNIKPLIEILSKVTNIAISSNDEMENLKFLLNNMECDVVLCSLKEDLDEYMSLVHLVMPNGWSAQDAIGKSFRDMHWGVKNPNGSHVLPMKPGFVSNLIKTGKVFERVGAYSLRDTIQMQRHIDDAIPTNYLNLKSLFLRFERQTIICLPEIQSFCFLIHSHFVDVQSNLNLFINAIEKSKKNCYLWKVFQKNKPEILKFMKSCI